MMEWAESVMQLHADRKSVLEVEFQGEEGTGLGPTLEFYALIAAEFQRTSLGIWLCDDDFPDDESRQVRCSEPCPPSHIRLKLLPPLCSGGPGWRFEASGLLCAALVRPLPCSLPSGQ